MSRGGSVGGQEVGLGRMAQTGDVGGQEVGLGHMAQTGDGGSVGGQEVGIGRGMSLASAVGAVGGQYVELGRGARIKFPNRTIDQGAVVSERLVTLFNARKGCASNVTRQYNQFVAFVRSGMSALELQNHCRSLRESLQSFVGSHDQYVQLASIHEPVRTQECEMQCTELIDLVSRAEAMLNGITREDTAAIKPKPNPNGSISGKSTVPSHASSTSSARAKVSAKKAALQAKVMSLKRIQELEYERIQTDMKIRQTDMKIRQAELEGELFAATEEERVLNEHLAVSQIGESIVHSMHQETSTVHHYSRDNSLVTSQPGQDIQVNESGFPRGQTEHENQIREAPVTAGYPEIPEIPAHSRNQHSSETQNLIDVLSLPKTTLKTFDGDPLSYSSFINAFDCCVGKMAVDGGAKLNRLLEYCTGKAAKVLKPCSLMKPDEGYIEARRVLKERFGNEYRISEAWVKNVTEGPPIKSSGDALQDLADDVCGCTAVLRAMNKLNDIDSRGGMLKILDRLPAYLQSRWRRTAVESLDRIGRYPNIEELARFLQKIAREMNDPVFGVADSKAKERPSSRAKGSSFQVEANQGQTEKSAGSTEDKTKKSKQDVHVDQRKVQKATPRDSTPRKCYVCSGEHTLRNCRQFSDMADDVKLKTVKEKRLCFNCLETRNHSARWCGKAPDCNIDECKRKHSTLLHAALKSDAGNIGVRQAAQSMACGYTSGHVKVALPIVAVWVRGKGQDAYIRTHALLDPGSNRTFCSMELAEKLNITGNETMLSLETLDAVQDSKAVELALEVTGTTGKRNTRRIVQLPRVFGIRRFPALKNSRVLPSEVELWSHMKDIPIAQDGDRVSILIGQDVPQALVPLEVRRGEENEPYAMRTALGWTVNGPLGELVVEHEATCNFVNLEDRVARVLELDTVPDGHPMSAEDRQVMAQWDETTILENDHYIMEIPFKTGTPNLPDNRVLAEK